MGQACQALDQVSAGSLVPIVSLLARRPIYQNPRMYGMFGGRSPFSNIGPRVVWYFMFMNGVSMRCPTAE
jgi:hypothetical protein